MKITFDDTTKAFLAHLWRGGGAAYWWYLDETETYTDKDGVEREKKRSVWFPVERLPAFVNPGKTEHTFFGIHPTHEQRKNYQRSDVKSIAAVNCLFCEFDGNVTLDYVLNLHPQPSYVSESSPGKYHAYWLLGTPYAIESNKDREYIQRIQYAWVDYCGGDDASKDLARVLRVPGTRNVKGEYAPEYPTVSWVHTGGQTYHLGALYDACEVIIAAAQARPPKPAGRLLDAGTSVIDEFNNRYGIEQCLRQYGYEQRGNRWVRPGGSRALVVVKDGKSYHHSGDDPMSGGYWRSPFDLYCHYEHSGNVKNAVRAAAVALGLNATERAVPVEAKQDTESTTETPENGAQEATEDNPILADYNDIAMSRYVGKLIRDDWRYVTKRTAWLRWSGTHWQQVDDQELHAVVKDIIEAMPDDRGMHTDWAKYLTFVSKYHTRDKRNALINDLMSEDGIAVSPENLDTHTDILPVQNGYITLRDGKLHEHDKSLLYTNAIPIDYNPDAECQQWNALLGMVVPNENVREFLGRYLGYCITGESIDLAILMYGNGANGKSTITNVVGGILGSHSVQIDSNAIMGRSYSKSYDLAKLEGTRLCQIKELPSGTLRSDEFKKIIDNGKLAIERKYEHPYEIDRTYSVIMHSNNLPRITDYSDAPWRRLALVEFGVTIPADQRVPDYDKHLCHHEAEGILAWLVANAQDFYAEGVRVPEEIQAATQRYREQEDSTLEWFKACCVVVPEAKIATRDAYDHYCDYADKPVARNTFVARIQKLGFEKRDGRVGGRVMQCFYGLGMKSDDDPDDEGCSTSENQSATKCYTPDTALQSPIYNTISSSVALVAEELDKIEKVASMEDFTKNAPQSATPMANTASESDKQVSQISATKCDTPAEATRRRYEEEDRHMAVLARLVAKTDTRAADWYNNTTEELEAILNDLA